MAKLPETANFYKRTLIENITKETVYRVVEIMKDDARLKSTDMLQTSWGRLMCQEFDWIRSKVHELSAKDKTLGKPIADLETDVLLKKLDRLEQRLNDLEKDPEKLLRLSIDNFKLNKE